MSAAGDDASHPNAILRERISVRFSITTPVLNGRKFIDQTILSVVSQTGPFSIRYHIQDGGSNDGTLDLLAAWKQRFESDFPAGCAGIEFTYSSAPDKGLYDAIGNGFAACGDSDVMTWINADDRFEGGAFATAYEIFSRYPDVKWVTGRPTVINENGEILDISPMTPFPQKAVAAGIFEGRFAPPFIQQEGTFWRSGLWAESGGLDRRFKLAGDFDLWRRFARHAPLVMCNTILGNFRFRDGQLSADKAAYHREIDASLSPQEVRERAHASKVYRRAGFEYPVLVRHYSGPWTLERWPMCIAPILGTRAFRSEHRRISLMRRFGLI
jgi:glycosyltransferase involved in cell wall biosynthesis